MNKVKKELEIYKEFFKEVKKKIRESGRTSVISITDLESDIVNVGNKLQEGENESD